MDEARIAGRLQISFAVLTCLGGLVLVSGTNTEVIPAIAIFFSVIGFLFVDWLRIFSLPPVAAYAAMGLVSIYCITNFIDMDQPGNHQMVSVSQLLVCIQAILMLQKKTIRIYEQLGIFCLLELVVAAVFNDALNYGLILIPICIVGIWGLTLLAIATSINRVDGSFDRLLADSALIEQEAEPMQPPWFQNSSSQSTDLMSSVAKRLPYVVMLSFAPAILVVAGFFFYALPRITNSGRVSNRASAVVGFSDEVRLEQLGQMGQNNQVAAKITLTRNPSNQPFHPIAGIYLRGAVLERYQVDRKRKSSSSKSRSSSSWSAIGGTAIHRDGSRPPDLFALESMTDQSSDAFVEPDSIVVDITYAASRSASLFTIPPYHSVESKQILFHRDDRWTLAREPEQFLYPRISYGFGTGAFRGGIQCEAIVTGKSMEMLLLAESPQPNPKAGAEEILAATIRNQLRIANAQKRWELYKDATLEFDRGAMPTIKKIADQTALSLRKSSSEKAPSRYSLAKALEQHFFINRQYEYSLNLNAESVVGMDPIEQFVSVDRVGHCQYFATALAMMLRSQEIPSRIVVGYKTDEYSEMGGHFLARQSHAHAWVEALMNRSDLDEIQIGGGQPKSDEYWVRFDPTPSSFGDNDQTSSAGKVLDLAQDIWDGLVIDMDSEKQAKALSSKTGLGALSQSYSQFVNQVSNLVAKIRAGDLGGGSLATYNGFSWQAAVGGIGLCFAIVGLATALRRKPSRWGRKQIRPRTGSTASRSTIDFYSSAMDQLERLGLERATEQTPIEFLRNCASETVAPLTVLTTAFYRVRYRGSPLSDGESDAATNPTNPTHSDVERALSELTRRVDAIRSGDDTAPAENLSLDSRNQPGAE